jgi:hypothetical protein
VRKIFSILAGGIVATGLGLPAQAHHAVQATVDINTTISAEAVLTDVDWINPHTWMHFDIVQNGAVTQQNVLIESLGISGLRLLGIDSKSALQVGGKFRIEYNPNRDGQPGGFLTSLVTPDGRTLDIKSIDPNAFRPQ